MHRGRIVDGTVRAVVNHTDGPRLQVDFGNDETARIYLWQAVETISANATTRKSRQPKHRQHLSKSTGSRKATNPHTRVIQ